MPRVLRRGLEVKQDCYLPSGFLFKERIGVTRLIIDGQQVEVNEGTSILEGARSCGIYIPALCSHPDLPPFSESKPAEVVYRAGQAFKHDPGNERSSGCGLCLIEVEGRDHPDLACEIKVVEGMKVLTHAEEIDRLRRKNLAVILASHPRACLICGQSEGCDRQNCSLNVPPEERCCSEFGHCEFRRVVLFVGINRNIPEYVSSRIPLIKGGELFKFDLNLCIGCLRCVGACQHLQGVGALSFVHQGGQVVVGTSQPSLTKSGCKFCGACVAVCPTGAMVKTSEKCGVNLTISEPMLPPEPYLEFREEMVLQVPEAGGVIHLLDGDRKIIYIVGTSNMHRELMDCLKAAKEAKFFMFNKDELYTQRQNELIQHFMKENGRMPRMNAELDDLF